MIVTATFDTGADSDMIQENVMPTPWLKKVQPILANIRAARDTTFTIDGDVKIQVSIDRHVTIAVLALP